MTQSRAGPTPLGLASMKLPSVMTATERALRVNVSASIGSFSMA